LTLSRTSDALLALARLGLGSAGDSLPEPINWTELKALAEQHGLSAIALDGIDRLPDCNRPPKEFLLQWIGEVLQAYECRYEQYQRAIAEMAGFYNSHDFKMMVLKGYACSLDWPNPGHRPCGDIDIWLFGQQKEADAILAAEKGIKIDTSEHHHTIFFWHDFMVENHYDFINIHHHKSNAKIEEILKKLGQDDSGFVELYGEKVYLPSPNHHALFLLKHLMMHFAAEGIMLRQVIDWGLHAKAHTKEIDWVWLESVLKQYGMYDMYNILNAICVEDFGFDSCIFHSVQFNPYTKEKVLNEIIYPEFGPELPQRTLTRFIYKIRRWTSNEWKHKLCYKESMWSAFWSGVKSHLMKPSSI
jgi:hypothetical protein